MSSQRSAIRTQIVSMIKAGVPAVGNRVYPDRNKKIFPSECPCIVVATQSEQAVVGVAAPRQYERTLRVAVQVIGKGVTSDDEVDEIIDAVEQTLFRDEWLNDLAADTVLSDTELLTNNDGSDTYRCAAVTFEVKYWTDAPADYGPLDDFLRVHSEMKPAPALASTAPAIDDITVGQGS